MGRTVATALFIAALTSAGTYGQAARLPAQPARTAPHAPTSNTFNVLSFGARPDGSTDSTVPIQRAIDAAQEAVGVHGGSVVYLPGGSKSYLITAPLCVKGRGVTIRGDGVGSILEVGANYAGPLLCVGLPAAHGKIGADYRPDAFGVLDASAAPRRGARRGISTLGKAAVLFQAHPFQLGGVNTKYAYNPPDYWVEAPKLTLEFLLARPRGATWEPGRILFGMSALNDPSPWLVCTGATTEELYFLFKSNEPEDKGPTGYYRISVPLDPGTGHWRVAIQVDLAAGRHAAWVNRQKVTTKAVSQVPDGRPFRPGLAFQPQDGATPFLIGARGKCGPGGGSQVIPLALYGFKVSKNTLYRWDANNEVLDASPQTPVRDVERYFTVTSDTVALLPLDDPPGPPFVRTDRSGGLGVGYWVPNERPRDTHQVTVRDLQLRARLMPGLVVGEHLGLRLERIESVGGWQGVGNIPLATSYPMSMTDCSLTGTDCGYFGYWQNLAARNTMISAYGRQAIRFRSGYCLWDHTFVGDSAPNTETLVSILGDDSGPTHEFRRLSIDNESGGPARAVIEFEQGYTNPQNRLLIDGLDVAGVAKDAVILRLIGYGAKGGWYKAKLDARNVTVYNREYRAALEVVGPPAWHGTFDASALPKAPIVGEASKIEVTPPAEFP